MKRKNRIPIGYIPTGTTNDFASSLHISRDILSAADTAVNGVPFACDIGTFNHDIFVYGKALTDAVNLEEENIVDDIVTSRFKKD